MSKQNQRRVWIGAALVGVTVLYVGMQGPNPKELQRELKSLRSLESEGKLEEALDRAEELRNKFPESPQTLAFLGHLYATQRRVPEAIEAYEKSLQARPDQSLVPLRLIRLYLQSGQSENAQKLLKDVDRRVQSGDVNREFLVEAAEMFLDFKDLLKGAPKAVILAKALQKEVAPRSTIGYKLEAQVLLTEMQEKQDANAPNALAMTPQILTTLQAGLAIDATDDWLLENLSFVKLTMRDSAGAMEAVGKWIQYHPSASKPLLVMAYLKFNEKDLDGSFGFIERLFKVSKENPRDPMYAEGLHLAGQVKSQSPQESQAFFQRACAIGYKASCERVTASEGASGNSNPIQPSAPPGAAPAP